MKSTEFIVFSACTMMLTALGIDIMLPAFAEVRKSFGLSPDSTATAQIVGFFFLGQIAQIIFGTLSDRLGRLAVLRMGFPLYIAGGLAAAFAGSLPLMFAARFFAGMGSSAVFTTTIAGVRDRYMGDKMAHIMSLIFTIFLFTPIFAPFLGQFILSFASWKFVFLTPPLFGFLIFIWSFRLEETLPPERHSRIRWNTVRQNITSVLSNKIFLRYTSMTTMLFIVLSAYVSSSEHIVGSIYKRPELFTWVFAAIGAVMSFVTFLNSRFAKRFGARKTIRALLVVYVVIALCLLTLTLISSGAPPLFLFFACVALLLSINVAVEPNASALALEPMGDKAGLASSVYGTAFFFFGASLGSVLSNLVTVHVLPLVLAFVVVGIAGLMLAFTAKMNSPRSLRKQE